MDRITKNDIISGLQKLGIKPGMEVEVHSSLKSFGYVESGGKAVIKALMEIIDKCKCMFFNIWDVVGLSL